jgi:hypothetical protein
MVSSFIYYTAIYEKRSTWLSLPEEVLSDLLLRRGGGWNYDIKLYLRKISCDDGRVDGTGSAPCPMVEFGVFLLHS